MAATGGTKNSAKPQHSNGPKPSGIGLTTTLRFGFQYWVFVLGSIGMRNFKVMAIREMQGNLSIWPAVVQYFHQAKHRDGADNRAAQYSCRYDPAD